MITAQTRLYAVLGDPIGHSLSPVMQNAWFEEADLNAVYLALQTPLSTAAAAMRALPALGVAGVNVTVPLKEIAARIADRHDQRVAALGAANVLRLEPDGALSAFNTDADGFVAALDEAHPGWGARTRSALVLGAGGAARAIGYGLAQAGVASVVFCNRTRANAEEAAARIRGGGVTPWERMADAFAAADLIVNATTLGLSGKDSPKWPIEAASRGAIVADAVYKPLRTPLLIAAEARGLATMDGLGMLIHQGALAFQLWTGQRPHIAAARPRLLAALGEDRYGVPEQGRLWEEP